MIFGAILVGACSGDTTAADAEDARARDSTLQLSVLLAHQDTEVVEPALVVLDTAPLFTRAARVANVESRLPPVVARATEPPRVVTTPKPIERKRVVESPRPTPATVPAEVAATPTTPTVKAAVRTATVPAGVELALDAGQRICVNTNERGDRFTARLARSIPASSGVAIPRGARATVQITSLVGPLGEETIDLAVRSISVDGKSYTVSSRVTDIELDRTRGAYRCIPDDGRITARLTRPLKITASG